MSFSKRYKSGELCDLVNGIKVPELCVLVNVITVGVLYDLVKGIKRAVCDI